MIGLIQKLFQPKPSQAPIQLELADIQGFLLSGYGHLAQTRYLFFKIEHPQQVKRWLDGLIRNQHITSAQWDAKPDAAMNLALTYEGILQLTDSESLQTSFAKEFREGMQHPERSRRIGDAGTLNDPAYWDNDWHQDGIHLLMILQAQPEQMEAFMQQHLTDAEGVTLICVEEGSLPADHKEHFGFRDAISQPTVEGSPQAQKPQALDYQLTKAGEFILGYRNEEGNYPDTPYVHISEDMTNALAPLPDRTKRDFGRNGTYLVYRKMDQDVAGFRRYFRDAFETPELGQKMAAKAVGRWPSGVSLVDSPEVDPGDRPGLIPNDFLYRDRDPHGSRCPFASHVRRLNPRDSQGETSEDALKSAQRRRIIRRGTLYGDPLPPEQYESDGQSRGLHFLCMNANLRRQFEFLQQSWVNNPKFHGLYDERDPLIGVNPDNSNRTFTVPQADGAQTLSLPNFVTVRGGAYLFLPSLSALRFLAQASTPSSSLNT